MQVRQLLDKHASPFLAHQLLIAVDVPLSFKDFPFLFES